MMSMETKVKTNEILANKNIILDWSEVKLRFSDYPLYFYSGAQSDLDSKKLSELLLAAVKLYDIDFVFIDNLQKYVRGDREQIVQETSRAISSLKDLTVDLKIPILLITHIRKPSKETKRVTMHDAKSSSTIYQDADIYLTLWNNKGINDEEDDMTITIDKNRMGEDGVDIKMIFEKEIAIYRERTMGAEIRSKEKRKSKQEKTEWEEEGFEEETKM